ncbi:MAG: XRE family transcriptional regulator [Candidatus Aquicultor sp.]|nr:XRE family transcriptional regulator [Candidatus Aquicultor sp.]
MRSFTPSRLTLARKRRGMTKKALAEAVGVSDRILTEYEAGRKQPTSATLILLAEELKFPQAFFSRPDADEFPLGAASFRALSTVTSRQRDQATAAGELAFSLADWIDDRFENLPKPDIPRLRGIDPETAAEFVRREWGLGERSIRNVIHLLEARGVRVFSLAEECAEVDAYSCWRKSSNLKQKAPFVFLNTMKSAEHSRMDAAHELGHLVLHWRHETPRGREVEMEANAFASAFLMPQDSIKANAPRGGTLNQMIAAKRLWGVSVAALVYRMHKLGLLTDWQYRALYIELGKKGYRKNEPNEIERETSQVLAKVFNALRVDGISKADVARDLCLPVEELNKLVFGLVITGLEGEADAASLEIKGQPNLRLV